MTKVAIVSGPSIFSLRGEKLYDLRSINIYRLSGELVGHLANASASGRRLDKATDKLFPMPLVRARNRAASCDRLVRGGEQCFELQSPLPLSFGLTSRPPRSHSLSDSQKLPRRALLDSKTSA
jgi:hypothetical protein